MGPVQLRDSIRSAPQGRGGTRATRGGPMGEGSSECALRKGRVRGGWGGSGADGGVPAGGALPAHAVLQVGPGGVAVPGAWRAGSVG